MRVQTEEWRQFIPGSRMYKGKKTLFYNGERLWDAERERYLVYRKSEQLSWEVIIILPGVEIIPEETFKSCTFLETVVMSDTIRRIEHAAFSNCRSLLYVQLSRNLEFIGDYAFFMCESFTSIFIPPSCREIGRRAFQRCKKLMLFSVPRHTDLGGCLIAETALIRACPFKGIPRWGDYDNEEEVHQWVKCINQGEAYEIHRVCCCVNPLMEIAAEIIYEIVKRKGLASFKKNELGMTPFDYLEANPFADFEINQRAMMKIYLLQMMGEIV